MSSIQCESHLQPVFKKGPFLAVLMSGSFVALLNQTLLATALPHIMRDLSLGPSEVQWVQSIFMMVNGVIIPITAFLIGRYTTRRLFSIALGLFGLGTLVCAISLDFSMLLMGRVLQGCGAGILMPLIQTILFLIYPAERRGTAMGMFGMVIGFAPAIGPTLSGWIVETFPWRSLFYIILPIVIIDLILAHFILKNVTEPNHSRVDILSIILSTLGFGGLLYGFSTAGSAGWGSSHVFISLGIGAITLLWFILRQLRLEEPILQFKVFRNKTFTISTIIGVISFISMIGGAVIMPLYMQNMLGYTALRSGLMVMPGALVMGAMNPVIGRLFDRFGARWLAIPGSAVVVVTSFLFTLLSEQTGFGYLVVVNAMRMLGVSMIMMPVTTTGLNQLPRNLVHHGTAMNNTMRQVSGAIGTALLVTIMTGSASPGGDVAGMIHGVNVSFSVTTVVAAAGFLLAFLIR